ncbi:threonine synthase [Pseudonocardia alni]|uniref:threonine synthase n=1 Tax=Pseudonocardia TaxID=1847 RepID=UPI00093740DD|nr:threonine synthase [Pseudonocardia sp. McavD-2-B]MCO7194422.1 threonine synthase [Pseudonocardia sp. McavD-2-B]MYW73883.1 threonine synthase [Pseudonocardia sp. SID8383]WFG42462.1 threonine synthase [Pseudonocardia alni]
MTLTAAPETTSAYDLGSARALACRECRHEIPLAAEFACPRCFGPLEVAYEFPTVTRASIEAGPKSIWRYKDLLPVPSTVEQHANTEPGLTRLIEADNLARALGVRKIWIKDDTGNPTHSFKDRVVAVALAAARELGFSVLCCPSTGNLANAVAAAAARAGWDSVVLIPSSLEQAKIVTTAVYGGTLLAVDGNYDDVNRLATELAAEHEDWAFVNVNVRPYYAEGSKTLGYEVAEQLGWRLPQQVVVPVASGSQLTKIDKGFTELGTLGLVEPTPYTVFGAQATGCSPVARAFEAGHDVIQPQKPDTIARSLAIGNPADGPYVLDSVRRTGGSVGHVSDEEVVAGIRLLARTEGVFAETAGGVTIATTRKLLEAGALDPDAETVLMITGDGLKTLDAVSGEVGPTATVPSTSAAVREALANRG